MGSDKTDLREMVKAVNRAITDDDVFLFDREADFVHDMGRKLNLRFGHFTPSEKQEAWLVKIWKRIGKRRHGGPEPDDDSAENDEYHHHDDWIGPMDFGDS